MDETFQRLDSYSKVTSKFGHNASTSPIYNWGCDLGVLERITEFRVDRQAEKNGQFDFEVRTKLNGGVKWGKEKWSQEKMSM